MLYNVSQDYDSAVTCFQRAIDGRGQAGQSDYTLLNKVGVMTENSRVC